MKEDCLAILLLITVTASKALFSPWGKMPRASHCLWYNKNLKIGGKTVYSVRLFSTGLRVVHDLFENGIYCPLKHCYNLKPLNIFFGLVSMLEISGCMCLSNGRIEKVTGHIFKPSLQNCIC